MKLISIFGLAVLLAVFVTVPSLAGHGGGGSGHSHSFNGPQNSMSSAQKAPKKQVSNLDFSNIKGESQQDEHKDLVDRNTPQKSGKPGKANFDTFSVTKGIDTSTPY